MTEPIRSAMTTFLEDLPEFTKDLTEGVKLCEWKTRSEIAIDN
jgi:hypothetical protein